MRPDVIAFHELDALVRNLSGQLASYRRRALAAEGRTHVLEQQLSVAAASVQALRIQVDSERGALAEARARVELLDQELADTRASLHEVRITCETLEARATPAGLDHELARENERLRSLLAQARDKAVRLVDRVRFLRQQTEQGTER